MLRKKLFFLWKIGLPSVIHKNTRQTIILCRVYFEKHSANHFFFAECAIKNTRQIAVYRHCRCRVLFAECFFCHGKVTVFGSGHVSSFSFSFQNNMQSFSHKRVFFHSPDLANYTLHFLHRVWDTVAFR